MPEIVLLGIYHLCKPVDDNEDRNVIYVFLAVGIDNLTRVVVSFEW